MSRLATVLVLGALLSTSSAGPVEIGEEVVKSGVEVVTFSHKIITDVLRGWRLLTNHVGHNANTEKNIFIRIIKVNKRMDDVQTLIEGATSASMLNLKQDIPSQVRMELRIDSLLDMVFKINSADHKFKEYVNGGFLDNSTESPAIERHTLEGFAQYIVSHDPDSVQSLLDRIHSMIHPEKDHEHIFLNEGLLELIRKTLQENSLCHIRQSPHQVVQNLYNFLQMTQLKGYAMVQFSWMLLRLYDKGTFTVESRLMNERYLERMAKQGATLKEALKKADTTYWRCDPKQHIEGESYVQLTRLLQGFIENEVNLNQPGKCEGICENYRVTRQLNCFDETFCARQPRCGGNLVDCQYFRSSMHICRTDPTPTTRRYDWVEYKDGRVLGKKYPCTEPNNTMNEVQSWKRWVFWKCSYCFCICDDATKSDRYFSLREVATTGISKVITGVRFVKLHGIIHIQIQEGTLESFGYINQTSAVWQPVDDFRIISTLEGVDYVKLDYQKRAIDLDDLLAPPQHVITGLKFRMIGSHLNLVIQATPFNFTTGELLGLGFQKKWIRNDNTETSENPRKKLTIESPDNPVNTMTPSTIDSQTNQYLLFSHSDIDKDVAQTTIPFLDAQPVAPQPPGPLAGIGIYHKGVENYGGFVGLKVFTYNYTEHVDITYSSLNDTYNKLNDNINTGQDEVDDEYIRTASSEYK